MMKEKIVELLVHLMSEMQIRVRLSDIDMAELRNKGFTQSEIGEALSWIHENLPVENGRVSVAARSPGGARRLLHDAEKAALSTESQGYLIQLRELGILDERDLETVIERAMFSGFERLSVEEIREIVAAVLFGKTGSVNRTIIDGSNSIH
jgi:uncharacterized protein Smg (DUF494 family)